MKNSGYITLFANCFFIKGAARALLYDSQRKKYFPVPLAMGEVLEACTSSPFDVFLEQFSAPEQEVINSYIDFLQEQGMIRFSGNADEMALFPPLDLKWDFPAKITNAVVVLEDAAHIDRFYAFKGDHFIHTIQFVLRGNIDSAGMLEAYLCKMVQGKVSGIQVLFDNSQCIKEEVLLSMIRRYGHIELMMAFHSGYDRIIEGNSSKLVMSAQPSFDAHLCGVVALKYMNLELNHFTEARQHNTCLNRKISIDADGSIRNCLSMSASFGNINSTLLSDVIERAEFTKYWSISKDQVSVCRDCEFRYVCTDCRAYLEDPADIYSKPLKCGYDPYTCTWNEWSTHPMKQHAVSFYGF